MTSVTLISSSLLSKTLRGVLNFPVTTHEPSGIGLVELIGLTTVTFTPSPCDTGPNV